VTTIVPPGRSFSAARTTTSSSYWPYLAFLFREAGFADVAIEDGTVTATR